MSPCILAACLALAAARDTANPADPWFGRDKAQHFAASLAMVTVVSGGLRAAGVEAHPARATAAAFALGVGIAKELRDRGGRGTPSWRDLAWDGFGVGVGFLLMAQAR